MKNRSNYKKVGLHRDRGRIGVRLLPDGTAEAFRCSKGSLRTIDEGPAPKPRKKKRISRKKVLKAACVVIGVELVVMAGLLGWRYCPVAIAVSDEDACYLKNEMEAEEALEKLVDENAPDGTKVTASRLNNNIEVRRSIGFGRDYKTAAQAEDIIWDNYVTTGKTTVTTKSRETVETEYIPEPDYRQDKNMVAGEKRVASEGRKGSQKITTQYKVRNGETVETEVVKVQITDGGTPAIIYKGILGLPDGEDWRTYEGLPVYKNGGELITDAKNYLGLRYIWDGHDLNRGVDCVGFVVEMYKKFGIKLPRSHSGLRKSGVAVKSLADARAGDIICYNGHVALYMGDGRVIHATRGKSNNVHISKVNYNKKRHIITIRRVVQ